jgi:hypothetical protein
MSGLLVKSTVIMKDNLEELNQRGLAARWPVLLGGAALTRLRLMDAVMAVKPGDPGRGAAAAGRGASPSRGAGDSGDDAPPSTTPPARTSRPPPRRADAARSGGAASSRASQLADYAGWLDTGPRSWASGALRPRRGRAARSATTRNSSRPRASRGCGCGWTASPPSRSGAEFGRLRLLPLLLRGQHAGRAGPGGDGRGRRRRIAAGGGALHVPAAAPRPAALPGRLLPGPERAAELSGRTSSRSSWSRWAATSRR